MLGALLSQDLTANEKMDIIGIRLTDEEQQVLDEHTRQHAGENPIVSLLSPPGLIVARKVKCSLCNKEFEVRVAIRKESEVGWTHPDFIPVGEHPVS